MKSSASWHESGEMAVNNVLSERRDYKVIFEANHANLHIVGIVNQSLPWFGSVEPDWASFFHQHCLSEKCCHRMYTRDTFALADTTFHCVSIRSQRERLQENTIFITIVFCEWWLSHRQRTLETEKLVCHHSHSQLLWQSSQKDSLTFKS